MSFPTKSKYVIIGAGIHGLSTAYHLALELKNKGSVGSGKDILVIDKSAIGAGASGIACGVIRNIFPRRSFVFDDDFSALWSDRTSHHSPTPAPQLHHL